MQPGLGMAVLLVSVLSALLHLLSCPIQLLEVSSHLKWHMEQPLISFSCCVCHPQHPGAVRSDGRGKQGSATSLTLCFLTPKLARKASGCQNSVVLPDSSPTKLSQDRWEVGMLLEGD